MGSIYKNVDKGKVQKNIDQVFEKPDTSVLRSPNILPRF